MFLQRSSNNAGPISKQRPKTEVSLVVTTKLSTLEHAVSDISNKKLKT
jgi:hypothetical protein